jgi:hypothetical protein
MFKPLNLLAGSFIAVSLCACTKVSQKGRAVFIVHPGEDITAVVNFHTEHNEFLLEPGTYSAMSGKPVYRSNIIIRRKDTSTEVRITDPMQLFGDHNVLDGLTWDADLNANIRESDPATLAISGSNNSIRHCIFRNMRATGHPTRCIAIGRREVEGYFTDMVANDNIIESCTFSSWGLLGEPKGSTESSTCISVGEENDKGKFTGTIIRNNLFTDGPYQQYGYNAAVKVFNSTTIEGNTFYKGQECMEIKYGNSTIRGNVIHCFSGYNILANRLGKNNLYENNVVYDVKPTDRTASSQGIMIWEAGNTVYRNNLIYNCAKAGLINGKQMTNKDVLQFVLIENNTFIGNATGINFANLKGSPRHVILDKNIFCGLSSASGASRMLSGFDPVSIENFSSNIYYNNILPDNDSTSLVADPQFVNADGGNYALQPNSPACGFGAIPCPSYASVQATVVNDPGRNVVIYPTRNKYVFHVGLVGMDVIPRHLELEDADGKVLKSRPYLDRAPAGLKVIDNINMSGHSPGRYILKITTSSGVILKGITIG